MNVELERICYHPQGTLGTLTVSGETFYTVENPWLDNQRNISCIPTGEYGLIWRESPRFGYTYLVDGVPDRTYILLHPANFPTDVQGCIGLGMSLMSDRIAVSRSKKALETFHDLMNEQPGQLIVTNSNQITNPGTITN